ncbi:MAG TPA: type VI secretion system baseplate subunit TssE [Desulfomonilia bacterium]|nr:type VI secretion system baseplate subunit TssE [Desulfomonilia bacterium]
MSDNQGNIRASLLDRLIDQEPEVPYEPVQYRLLDMRQIKALVIRDLENLLNTRRTIYQPSAEFIELNKSVFVYGLRDFTSQSTKSATLRKTLRQDIERTIARFEPRLRNVKIQIESDQSGNSLRFRINALLVIEPETEPVQFDTVFDINRSEYVITG